MSHSTHEIIPHTSGRPKSLAELLSLLPMLLQSADDRDAVNEGLKAAAEANTSAARKTDDGIL